MNDSQTFGLAIAAFAAWALLSAGADDPQPPLPDPPGTVGDLTVAGLPNLTVVGGAPDGVLSTIGLPTLTVAGGVPPAEGVLRTIGLPTLTVAGGT